MILISNADKKFGIGKDGGLLARLPDDMRFFKETTMGSIIVMGSRTYLSFPKRPLEGRENVVLTSRPEQFPEVRCFETVGDFLEFAKSADKEIYVCGGGSVYMQLLPYCEKALITKIDAELGADTFLPDLDRAPGWELTESGEPIETNGYTIRFTTYRNTAVRSLDVPEMEDE